MPHLRASAHASRVSLVQSARTGTERVVRNIIRTRAERRRFLPDHLFADPAWDMLLDLYLADILAKRVTVSSLCIASNVPSTTALRWIKTLEKEGLAERGHDPRDQRRRFISLSGNGLASMDGFFASPCIEKVKLPQLACDQGNWAPGSGSSHRH